LGNVERKTLLVVISLPKFTVKPPGKVFVDPGATLTLNCSATGDPRPVITWKRQGAALPVGRSHSTNDALVLSDVKKQDVGNYICVATSAGVFSIETISDVEVRKPRGKLWAEPVPFVTKRDLVCNKILSVRHEFYFPLCTRNTVFRRREHKTSVGRNACRQADRIVLSSLP